MGASAFECFLQINGAIQMLFIIIIITLYINSALLVLNGTSLRCNNTLLALNRRYYVMRGPLGEHLIRAEAATLDK